MKKFVRCTRCGRWVRREDIRETKKKICYRCIIDYLKSLPAPTFYV